MRFIFVVLLIMCWSASTSAMDKKEAIQMLSNGNSELKQEHFSEAIGFYEQVLPEYSSVQLFHNLSLAYFHNGNLGKAILFIEKAAKLKPLNKEVARNLRLMKENVDSEISGIPPFFIKSWMNAVANLLSIRAWLVIHLLLLFIGTGLLYYYLIKKGDLGLHFYYIRGLIIASFIVSLLFAAFAYNRILRANSDRSAIVMEDETPLRVGAEQNSQEVMKVNQGVKVNIEDEIADFYKVKLEDYTEAWVLKTKVERI